MIEIDNDKIYITTEALSWQDISHPNKTNEPLTSLVIIGSNFKLPEVDLPYHVHLKKINCGDAFDVSDWNRRIAKDLEQQSYFVEDRTLDDEGEKKYRAVNSGHFALSVKCYATLSNFLADGEFAYFFWLASMHGKLGIVAQSLTDAVAIAQGFLMQSRQLQGIADIDARKLRTYFPSLDSIIRDNADLAEDKMHALEFSTKKVASMVDAAYQRRYATARLFTDNDADVFVADVAQVLKDYVSIRAGKDSASHKLTLLKQQDNFLLHDIRERLKHDKTKTTFISAAVNAEYILMRPEAWQETGKLPSRSSGGAFIKTQRRVFQMLLAHLQIDRQLVATKPVTNFHHISEELLEARSKAISASQAESFKVEYFDDASESSEDEVVKVASYLSKHGRK